MKKPYMQILDFQIHSLFPLFLKIFLGFILGIVWHFECLFLCLVRRDQSKLYVRLILLYCWGNNLIIILPDVLWSVRFFIFIFFWMKHKLFLLLSEPLWMFPLLLLIGSLLVSGRFFTNMCWYYSIRTWKGDPLQIYSTLYNSLLSGTLQNLASLTLQFPQLREIAGFLPGFLLPLLPGNSK